EISEREKKWKKAKRQKKKSKQKMRKNKGYPVGSVKAVVFLSLIGQKDEDLREMEIKLAEGRKRKGRGKG
ncbi:hypothetical protein RUM43_012607, partial [Polyplax serrata]